MPDTAVFSVILLVAALLAVGVHKVFVTAKERDRLTRLQMTLDRFRARPLPRRGYVAFMTEDSAHTLIVVRQPGDVPNRTDLLLDPTPFSDSETLAALAWNRRDVWIIRFIHSDGKVHEDQIRRGGRLVKDEGTVRALVATRFAEEEEKTRRREAAAEVFNGTK